MILRAMDLRVRVELMLDSGAPTSGSGRSLPSVEARLLDPGRISASSGDRSASRNVLGTLGA